MPDILKTFPVLSRPPHPTPSLLTTIEFVCISISQQQQMKPKANGIVCFSFSVYKISRHCYHISISKCFSPKSDLKCVETFSLLFVCPHFFRIFGPIRPARGRASTHIFECRKTYRTKIPLAWKYLLNPKIVC